MKKSKMKPMLKNAVETKYFLVLKQLMCIVDRFQTSSKQETRQNRNNKSSSYKHKVNNFSYYSNKGLPSFSFKFDVI